MIGRKLNLGAVVSLTRCLVHAQCVTSVADLNIY